MDLEQFKRVEEVFDAAMALPENERSAHVERACGADAAMRERVMRLLGNATRDLVCEDLRTTDSARPASHLASIAALDDLTGRAIGPYQVMELIGEGGFGVVYRAQQSAPVKRMVALKIIKLGMDTAQVIARFEAERQALALMDHPHIARVFDAGVTEKGRPYFVMELVSGVPITRYCDQRRMPIAARLKLFAQVCQAVQHAHGKGVIHRDIKPSNILVSEAEGVASPRIIDFGIAKATRGRLTDHTALTEARQFIGTPEYMSPEQAGGLTADVDTRTDVYSLGVLMHELLVGVTPFDFRSGSGRGAGLGAGLAAGRGGGGGGGDGSDVLKVIREQEPRKPSTRFGELEDDAREIASRRATEPRLLRRALRGDLDWIMLKAMEKDPARRYETAADLAHEIERFLRNQPVTARPPGALYVAHKFVRRHRVSVAAAAAIALAMVVGLVAAVGGLREANIARASQQDALKTAEDRLWESLLAQARAARSGDDISRRFQALTAIARAAQMKPGEELRDEAIASLALDDFAAAQTLTLSDNVSARGLRVIDRIADGGQPGEIRVISTRSGEVIARLPTPPLKAWIMWFSVDGRYLAAKLHSTSSNAHFMVWEIESGRVIVEFERQGTQAGHFAFCRFEERPAIALVDNERHIAVFTLDDGQRVGTIDVGGDEPWWLESDPLGRRLAVSHGTSGKVSVWELRSGSRLLTIEAGAFIRGMRFTRRGDRLIGCGQDYRAHVWDATTGEEVLTLVGHQGDCVEAFLSPDSSIAATTGWDNTVRLWDMRTGAQIATPMLNAAAVGFGDALVTSLGSLTTLWRFEDSPEFERILPQTPLRSRATIALDAAGDRIIAGDETGVRLFDAATGEELARIIDAPAVFARIVEDGRAALVATDSGVWRVPLEVHRGVQILPGEPQRLLARTGIRGCDFDPAQRRMVLVLSDEVEIYEWPSRRLLHHLPGFAGLDRTASLDPTGQWLFTGNWRGENGRVWDVNTGQIVHQFNAPNVTGAFNPAGGELLTSTGVTFDTLAVGAWNVKSKRTRNNTGELAGLIAYSADGALVAVTHSQFEIHLLNAKTGRILARLSSPEPAAMSGIALSADGSTLAATTTLGEIHVWDLASIRAELAAMGLDWED